MKNNKLHKLIKESLYKKNCSCGCNTCDNKKIIKENIIKKLIEKLLKESNINTKVFSLTGLLIINQNKNTVRNLLSDIRAIEGVTIVKEEAYDDNNEKYHKIIINVKIDPSPFINKGGFNESSIDQIVKDIKRLNGVIAFKTNKKLTSTTT
jgi:hypothetical protein